jgi:predicted RNase H-like HicB family nuclease
VRAQRRKGIWYAVVQTTESVRVGHGDTLLTAMENAQEVTA